MTEKKRKKRKRRKIYTCVFGNAARRDGASDFELFSETARRHKF